jgi:hypothetical protein
MKLKTIAISILLGTAVCAPAFAGSGQAEYDRFMSKHPKVAANPNLLNDPHYLAKHPDVREFMNQHPNLHHEAAEQGAYGANHQWHNRDWWAHNDKKWAEEHHHEWFENHH